MQQDTYGTHLDSNGETIDLELEKRNFYASMKVLSEIWNEAMIDDYPVDCKPVKMGSTFKAKPSDPVWIAKHVKKSRYALQIVKCLNLNCCGLFKTNWIDVFPTRFIPPPTVYQYGKTGLEAF